MTKIIAKAQKKEKRDLRRYLSEPFFLAGIYIPYSLGLLCMRSKQMTAALMKRTRAETQATA